MATRGRTLSVSLQNPGDVGCLDVLEASAMIESSVDVRPSPDEVRPDALGSWLVVMPFQTPSLLVVVVGGYADVHTAPQLRAQLLGALVHERDTLVLDVQDLEFCDLHGLDALDDAAEAAQEAGMSVTFRGTAPHLAWLQEFVGSVDAAAQSAVNDEITGLKGTVQP